MKEKFFDIIGKCPKDVKVLYIPTAGIEKDGLQALGAKTTYRMEYGLNSFKRLSKNLFFVCYNPVYAYKAINF